MSDRREPSFVDLCIRGEASPGQIDDFVDVWHQAESEMSLHEFLGMTWDEYSAWVRNPGLLSSILAAHRGLGRHGRAAVA